MAFANKQRVFRYFFLTNFQGDFKALMMLMLMLFLEFNVGVLQSNASLSVFIRISFRIRSVFDQ